jgi:carbon monoxide dehydrogenase subunit G
VQLEQSFELPVTRSRTWTAFKDVSLLVSCLPGASLLGPADANPLQFLFSVKLGPIAASFKGEGRVTYDESYTGSLSGSGADRATNSRVKGEAKFALHETPSGTRVDLLVDYSLSGALAQFGRSGIVKELASSITQQFAANLRAKLEDHAGSPAQSVSPGGEEPRDPRTGSEPVRLDGGRLLWGMLWSRIKRLFGIR